MNNKDLFKKEHKELKNNMSELDHIIIASSDLEALASEFYELTGVKPVAGGRHEGKGTANQLIGLEDGAYIELIGPDPKQDDPHGPRPLRVDEVTETTVVGWAVRPNDDINDRVKEARKAGYDPGDSQSMNRKTPEGEVLEWRLTPLSGGIEGTIPFFIDWQDSKHPSLGIPDVTLISLKLTHPQPDEVRLALEAVGALDLVSEICQGDVSLALELETPNGRVHIS